MWRSPGRKGAEPATPRKQHRAAGREPAEHELVMDDCITSQLLFACPCLQRQARFAAYCSQALTVTCSLYWSLEGLQHIVTSCIMVGQDAAEPLSRSLSTMPCDYREGTTKGHLPT